MDKRQRDDNSKQVYDFLSGGGEMGERIRAYDWSRTSVGPVEYWPQSLRTAISICLNATMPLSIIWGRELIQFYNDAYIPIAVGRHPDILGGRVPENWPDTWEGIQDYFNDCFEGKPSYVEDALLVTARHNIMEECYYTMSFSPIRDESGDVGGVFHAILETSVEVIDERRLQSVRRLGEHLSQAQSVDDVFSLTADELLDDVLDIPFSAIYRVKQPNGRLRQKNSDEDYELALLFPNNIELHKLNNTYLQEGIVEVLKENQEVKLEKVDEKLGGITSEPWEDEVKQALILPLTLPGKEVPFAVMILGISARQVFNESYRNYFDQLHNRVVSSLANVLALEEERKRTKALEEIDKAKTTFFSNISHELRTPLTLILGAVEHMLAEESKVLLQHQEDISLLHRNSLRLLKLVNTLLDFSRIEAGRLKATYQPVALDKITADMASVFRSAVEKQKLHYHVQLNALSAQVYVDTSLWERIVFNLLSNALKFTFEGSISIVLEENDDKAILKVADSGEGIPKEELPRLFSRFHRIEGARSKTHEGTGIGLAMVKELVRLHGGKVTVESRKGEGSTFKVQIPFGKEHLPAEQVKENGRANGRSLSSLPDIENELSWLYDQDEENATNATVLEAKLKAPDTLSHNDAKLKRVMIVDDNADMRHYLQRMLQNHYQLQMAGDGEKAWQMMQTSQPDLIISDIMMPNLDGLGLLKKLREHENYKTIPLIFLSARAGEEARIGGLEAGADDYLVKPFSARELLARVQTQLSMSAMRQEIREKDLELLEEVKRRKENLKRVFQQAPAAIAILSGSDYRVELANAKMCELWQLEHDKIIDEPLMKILPVVGKRDYLPYLNKVYQQAEPQSYHELPLTISRFGKEQTFYINLLLHPLRDAAGEVESIIALLVDVNEQVKVRKALEASNRDLKAVNADLDSFVYTASHDLKGPIINIESLINILLPSLPQQELKDPYLQKIIGMIHTSIDRFKVTIADLSDIARVQKDAREEVRKLMISDVVRDVLLDLELSVTEAKADIITELDDCEPISFSPKNLRSVIYNLISNAIKYRSYNRKVRVEISCYQQEDYLVFKVADNGLGMELKDKKALFAMFKRLHSHVEGSGVGLYIVKRIMDYAGGKIEVDSQMGQGTEFRIFFPLSPTLTA